ncbi:putative transcription factor [Paramecium bursaria Chlorella virus NY2B]|uniref:Putative transcription factor n=1 Tax=Paramecium bursaria Chlorella virus NYs1 TaxID=83442 RepID=M1I974_9PHYC|nr:putative transcription factor [Paramecium bursaria Chlorella virus NYs1]AGE54340.1 putative transcription factor [Paramecium bursaria Chlorella virus IL-5-2s1]AGE55026.1 putative transcription factor [Paramecium bursaria Chlorella virus MA1D]AGE58458.1 putative transcription factor [Paramecium bursaria Chlorella virus NY2B]AGE58841.1 putative transcription factor [Paramecium bursaria Chlorella virus NYs1]
MNEIARTSQVDKDFSKLTFKLSKHKTKKEKRFEETSKFSTLHEAIESNLLNFQTRKSKLENGVNTKKTEEKIKKIEEDEINYILDTIPFIKEYNVKETISDTAEQNAIFQVKNKNMNTNTFRKYLFHVEKVSNHATLDAVTERETIDQIYTCTCGGQMEMWVNSTQSDLVCNDCGATQPFIETYTGRESNEGMAYKRINHLAECLNALQGKEGTNVPQEVVNAVKAEFKKNRISTTSEIKPSKVKQFLKKLGYSMYYENIYTIANMISGVPTLKLSRELEKRFKDMFFEIQEPFFRHKPPKRKNFLSYNYVLYKFAELLGEDDLLQYFPLLKCSKNLHNQDVIWKKICNDLKWQYIDTV